MIAQFDWSVFMFYDIYKKLCEDNGEKPYQLPLKLGAKSNSVVAQWKNGSLPRPEMIQKIADYFNVSVEYLMFGEVNKEKPVPVRHELKESDMEILTLLKEINEKQKKAIVDMIHTFIEED